MTKILMAVPALAVSACVATCAAERDTLPALSTVEQEVIEALLREEPDLASRELAVWNTATTSQLRFAGGYENAVSKLKAEGGSHGPSFAEAVEDMAAKGRTEARFTQLPGLDKPVHLLDAKLYTDIFTGGANWFDAWLLFYERCGSAQRVVTVSRPGLDAKATRAVLSFGVAGTVPPSEGRFETLRREGGHWVIDRYKVGVDSPGMTEPVTVACELRYVVQGMACNMQYVAQGTDFQREDLSGALKEVSNQGTNLVCSISSPYKLITAPSEVDPQAMTAFVMQVVEPKLYAGQVLTIGKPFYNGYPARLFRFGRRYELRVGKKTLGDLDFRLHPALPPS